MKHLRLIALFSLLAVPLSAQTPEFPEDSGNSFLRICSAVEKENRTQTESENVMACLAYVSGFGDGVLVERSFARVNMGRKVSAPFCRPSGVEKGQIIRVVLKHIRDNPADAHHSTASLILSALRKAYPCQSQ